MRIAIVIAAVISGVAGTCVEAMSNARRMLISNRSEVEVGEIRRLFREFESDIASMSEGECVNIRCLTGAAIVSLVSSMDVIPVEILAPLERGFDRLVKTPDCAQVNALFIEAQDYYGDANAVVQGATSLPSPPPVRRAGIRRV